VLNELAIFPGNSVIMPSRVVGELNCVHNLLNPLMTNGIPDSAFHTPELSRLHLQETSILHVMICPCDCAAVRKLEPGKPIEIVIGPVWIPYVSVSLCEIRIN